MNATENTQQNKNLYPAERHTSRSLSACLQEKSLVFYSIYP